MLLHLLLVRIAFVQYHECLRVQELDSDKPGFKGWLCLHPHFLWIQANALSFLICKMGIYLRLSDVDGR